MLFEILFGISFLIRFSDSAFIDLYDGILLNSSQSIKRYFVNSPAYAQGNLDFPVMGAPLFVTGCSGIRRLKQDVIDKISNISNIVLISHNEDDSSCFKSDYIFHCQERIWCKGVVIEDPFYDPSGQNMWSYFDEHRSRDAYKVPLVEFSSTDMTLFINLIRENRIKYGESPALQNVTLTLDHNPWEDMCTSPAFILFAQALSALWSLGCLILSIKLLILNFRKAIVAKSSQRKMSTTEMIKASPMNVANVSLILQAITHLVRVIYFAIDPFFCRQIFTRLTGYIFISLVLDFEIATNILLAFVIREIIKAKAKVHMMRELTMAYSFIFIFLAADFSISVMTGLAVNFFSQGWIVKGVFFTLTNIVLGVWYSLQGFRFLRTSNLRGKKIGVENERKKVLAQLSLLSAIGITFFGIVAVFVSFPFSFGNPWSYFTVFILLTILMQVTSFVEILVFGGVPFRLRTFVLDKVLLRERKLENETARL